MIYILYGLAIASAIMLALVAYLFIIVTWYYHKDYKECANGFMVSYCVAGVKRRGIVLDENQNKRLRVKDKAGFIYYVNKEDCRLLYIWENKDFR